MTARGIETDLSKSIYKSVYGEYVFTFSSKIYKLKFDGMLDNYIKEETTKIYKRYNINLKCDYFLAIALYNKIEKRGFRIVNKRTQEVINKLKIYEVR